MKLLRRTAMFDGAAANGRGHKWITELLIFFLVFSVFTAAQSILFSIPLIMWFIIDNPLFPTIEAATENLLNDGNILKYFEETLNSTEEILSSMPSWLYIVQLFTTAGGIAVVILYCRIFEKRGTASLGFGRKHILREYIIGGAVGTLLLTLTVILSRVFGVIHFEKGSFNPVIWILCLLGYMVQGASEEVLCRGYLMVSIARKSSLPLAVILNSAAFAVLHLLNPGITFLGIFNIFLTGCVLSVYVIKRGNLWGACALHSMWNFTLGNVFGFNVSGLTKMPSIINSVSNSDKLLFNGGQFGLEAGLDETIIMSAALLVLLFFVKVKEPADKSNTEMSI